MSLKILEKKQIIKQSTPKLAEFYKTSPFNEAERAHHFLVQTRLTITQK